MTESNDETNRGLDMAKQSLWVTEKYTAPSGKVYQRYKLDEKGNKIPKDPNMTVATVEKVVKEKKTAEVKATEDAAKRARKARNAMNRDYKKKHGKRIVPFDLLGKMRTVFTDYKAGKGCIRASEFMEKNAEYHVILANTEKDWLLLHSIVKKGFDHVERWFFFNPYNETAIDFDHKAHVASKVGDKGIPWPAKVEAPTTVEVVPSTKKLRKPRKAVA